MRTPGLEHTPARELFPIRVLYATSREIDEHEWFSTTTSDARRNA